MGEVDEESVAMVFKLREDDNHVVTVGSPSTSTTADFLEANEKRRQYHDAMKKMSQVSLSGESMSGSMYASFYLPLSSSIPPHNPWTEESETESEKGTPETLADLEKVCTVGTGTFGRVYLVKSKRTGDFMALKCLALKEVVALKQVEHVHSEKRILAKLNHPFLIKLHWSYRDSKALYFLFDFIPGGELFSYLRSARKFSVSAARFYAAEIVSALAYLHDMNIVYRDLKPENLILDKEGHIRLTDFGFAKELTDRTWTLCGTPEYLAPEIIESRGHNKAVDWWSLGVLIYEMLAGAPPFRGTDALEIYEHILSGRVRFPKSFDPAARDLVKKFLVHDRTHRLGNMKGRSEDVKKHKFFRDIDWDDVLHKKLKPPIVPKVFYEGDCGNFDEYEEEEMEDIPNADESEQALFSDW